MNHDHTTVHQLGQQRPCRERETERETYYNKNILSDILEGTERWSKSQYGDIAKQEQALGLQIHWWSVFNDQLK